MFDGGLFKGYFDAIKEWHRQWNKSQILNQIDMALDTGDKAWYYELQGQLQLVS
jgi:uncharacterized protein YpiB (UPF0302 family)